ncbi:MAG: hypothetical protein JEZ05_06200 [Tenericutes bacterium]|nr:hypothetical protein [Mycoplasmatota bacterium]
MLQTIELKYQFILLASDWSQIWHDTRYFILGFITGIILLILSLVFIFSRKERIKTKRRLSKTIAIDDHELLKMIEDKQNTLVKTVKLTDNGYFKVALDLSLELSEEISRYYFPNSKYPLYELSIQEILDLSTYITKRFDTLINGTIVKKFKNYRVATVMDLLNTRKRINDSKLMQVTRKLKLQQVYTVGRAAINYANPIYWFRKLAIKPATVLVTKEICKRIIQIFGEETNKIYSKAIFKQEDEQKILKEIDAIIGEEEE